MSKKPVGKVLEIIREMPEERIVEIVSGSLNMERSTRTNNGFMLRCPFHDDKTPSLSLTISGEGKGLYHCFGCGASGTLFTLVKKQTNKTNAETAKLMGIRERDDCTLESFCQEKGINRETVEKYGIYEGEAGGVKCVVFPYFAPGGEEVLYRKRRFSGQRKFDMTKTGKADLSVYVPKNYVHDSRELFIAEGETDALTLSQFGYPVIGLPGSQSVKAVLPAFMKDKKNCMEIFVCIDNDSPGQSFALSVCSVLAETNPNAAVYLFNPSDYADDEDPVKDVNDLYLSCDALLVGLNEEIKRAGGQSPASACETLRREMCKLPANYDLSIPGEYTVREQVVRTAPNKEGELEERVVLAYPLFYNGLVSGEDGLLVSLLIPDGKGFTEKLLPKRSAAKRGDIIGAFADNGLMGVTDKNAALVVEYLADCENANIDRPLTKIITATGWIDDKHYAPFALPENATADNGYKSRNSKAFKDFYEKNIRPQTGARAIFAASVGGTILDITGCRSHVVYVYGPSQGGKSAAQYASAAFYGDPEQTMTSMYGTVVGIERMAYRRNDMSFILDERQVASGSNGKSQELVERMVYMLAGGRSKIRGKKDGGIQEAENWRTVAIISGEESLSKDASQAGVYTRSLPLYGPPFESRECAANCYRDFSGCYGLFGEWVKYIIPRRDEIKANYDMFMNDIPKRKKEGADISLSHYQYMANMATAALYLEEFFGSYRPAARILAMELVELAMKNFGVEKLGYAERALHALGDFVSSNINSFRAGNISHVKRWGEVNGSLLNITNEGIKQFCVSTGFDAERIKRDWAQTGTMKTWKSGNTMTKGIVGMGRVRCCEIDFGDVYSYDLEIVRLTDDGEVPF